jgi:Restriction endonuclease S subunits
MSKWNSAILSDAVELVIDYRGKTPKKLGSDWCNDGYRALSAKNIKTGQIVQEDTIRYVDEELYHKWMKEEIKKGDIIVTSEAPFGQIYYWDSDEKIVLSQRLFAIRIKKEFDARYIYQYMTTPLFYEEMSARATGTTVIGLRQPELMKCKIKYPNIEIQKKISAILCAIDRKINNNMLINRNLADQIQTIYCNDYDPLAYTPSGVLSDICHYSTDKILVSALSASTYYSTENMHSNKAGAVDAANLPSISQTTKCYKGDVLVSNIRPYFKKIVYVTNDCGCSTDVLCFSPKESNLSAFLFGTLYVDRFFDYMVAGSKGTKMPRGDKKQIMNYPIVIPSEESLVIYNETVMPMLEQIACNKAENKRLMNLRDTLLPKLMSGEINVSGIRL